MDSAADPVTMVRPRQPHEHDGQDPSPAAGGRAPAGEPAPLAWMGLGGGPPARARGKIYRSRSGWRRCWWRMLRLSIALVLTVVAVVLLIGVALARILFL